MPLDGFPAADEVPLKPRSGNRDPAGIWGAAASESGSLSVSPVNNAHVAIYLPHFRAWKRKTILAAYGGQRGREKEKRLTG